MTAEPTTAVIDRRYEEDCRLFLIELLVVIGIIVLLIGALGLALRGGGGNVALQSAQGTLSSLIAATRSHAALSQSTAMLVVDADPASDGFLHTLHIAVQTAGGWNFVGDAVLPSGAYLVPGTPSIPGADCTPEDHSVWPVKRVSTVGAPANLVVVSGGQSGSYIATTFSFTSAGTLATNGGDKLVLGTARRTSAITLVFDQPAQVRGVILSVYGAPILINNATGFDN